MTTKDGGNATGGMDAGVAHVPLNENIHVFINPCTAIPYSTSTTTISILYILKSKAFVPKL